MDSFTDNFNKMAQETVIGEELLAHLKAYSLGEAEKIPEVRALLSSMIEMRKERQEIAEAIGVVPYEDLQKGIKDFFETRFNEYAQEFFSALYTGMLDVTAKTINLRFDALEKEIERLRSVFLLGVMSPIQAMESELVHEVMLFLDTQPQKTASVHVVYEFLANEKRIPIPGNDRTHKYQWIIRLMRTVHGIKEFKGFYFEKEA